MIKLSILIPTMYSRVSMLAELLKEFRKQSDEHGLSDFIEILFDTDDGTRTTGSKRNALLFLALGEYVVFFDDDDWPSPEYLKEILKAIDRQPDVIGFNGYITSNGGRRIPWRISKDLPYKTIKTKGMDSLYLRFNNHLSPIRKEIALAIKYPDKTIGEDYDYAVRLNKSGLIKTEVYIEKDLYWYRYVTKTTAKYQKDLR